MYLNMKPIWFVHFLVYHAYFNFINNFSLRYLPFTMNTTTTLPVWGHRKKGKL